MPAGVKCDAAGCHEFGELPADGMGQYQLLGGWIMVRLAHGTYYACGPDHASDIAHAQAQVATDNAATSEAHAVQLQRESSGGEDYDPAAQAAENESAAQAATERRAARSGQHPER